MPRCSPICLLSTQGRSLPSGITQDWAPGTPASLEQLATLMISISDNTATDALMGLIGRERLEAIRTIVREVAPDAGERISYAIPVRFVEELLRNR